MMQNLNLRLSVCLTIILFANVSIAASQLQAQGRLSKVRDAVRRHHSPSKKHDDSHDDDHDDEDHHGHGHRRPKRHRRHHGGGGNVGFFLTNAFWDDGHRHCQPPQVVEHIHIYEPVPVITEYVQPAAPVVVEQIPAEAYPVVPAQPVVFEPAFGSYFSNWHGRISAFYGYDFDDLWHGSFAALFQAPGWLGLDTSVTMFRESGSTFRDHLWLGDVNLVYEAINTNYFRGRVGVGVNWLGDYYGGDAGANLTFGLDWQVNPNWVITGETDFGSLGDTDLFHAQISLGRQFERAEWTTGYNYYDIGGTAIGGVFTGLRFRF